MSRMWWRCSNGLSRRLLAASALFCLFITGTLWFRCDDGLTSSHRYSFPVSGGRSRNVAELDSVSLSVQPENEEEVVDYDYSQPAGELNQLGWSPDVAANERRRSVLSGDTGSLTPVGYHEIECLINDEQSIACRQEDSTGEVFVPFSFVSKYFEIYGKMATNSSRFLWQHSYSRVYPVDETYSPFGVFMSFDHYNVEVRDRVKCISGIEGVPVSTQWGPQGYFYPTQIAQYALSHYSKFLKVGDNGESGGEPIVIEDAEDESTSRWTSRGSASIRIVVDQSVMSRVVEFQASKSRRGEPELTISLPDETQPPPRFYLSLDVRFIGNGSVTVVITTARNRFFRIHYTTSNSMLWSSSDSDIFYGIGTDRSSWSTLGRDVAVDLQKGVANRYAGRKKRPPKILVRRVVGLELRGAGQVDNVTLSVERHLSKFFYGVDWLVRRQEPTTGGWSIPVARSLADGRLTLPPGWLSAMAQGQAMSALVRAYGRTNRKEYMDAAILATEPFNRPSSEGGVVARFMDRYDWYEEYPTTPACFVLNGFIYALVGLYDVAASAPPGDGQTSAARLYAEGLRSLRAMLPLFDTGTGTVYDLRHLTLAAGGRAAPNRARWDYHAAHINQLAVLVSILRRDGADQEELETAEEFEEVARRWASYMNGKRSPHN